MATVRAKFTLTSIKHSAYNTGATYEFTPQYDASIPEDVRFAKTTPSGSFVMYIDNPAVEFTLGAAYYADFTPAVVPVATEPAA